MKFRYTIRAAFAALGIAATSSVSTAAVQADSLLVQAKADSAFVKTGFSFGVLPAISYDSDLGFQYGILTNLYWYGDGSRYPSYNHSLYLEVSRYVAGTMLCRAYYDSPEALSRFSPNLRLTADFTFFRDLLMDFTGFNGAQSVYNPEWTDEDDPAFRSRAFYAHHRQMTRLMAGVRYDIPQTKLYWQAGVTAFNMKIGQVHFDELQHEEEPSKTLYDLYREAGVFRADEADGGTDVFLRLGFGYDSRDSESFPTKGVWSEALLAVEPGLFTSRSCGFARLTLKHSQYFSLGSPTRVLAYRLMFQNRLCGRVPFYLLPHLTTNTLTSATSQGLGGSKTMRGIKRNRVVADGVALGNVEFRWLPISFNLFGQRWDIGTNIFADFGITTQEYEVNTEKMPIATDLARGFERSDYFRSGSDCLHSSLGLGLKIHMNHNFIISADYGKALRADDGSGGFYVQLNYLF